MAGNLTLERLEKEVGGGTIDTVVAAFTDLQGRLMGKRFHARYFLDGGHEETHGCDYLLATDIDMEPVPGYSAASWEKGYGDFVLKPDLATLCFIPWLPATALVLCDVLDHHTHAEIPHSPRAVLKKQIARLAKMNMKAYMASELEFFLFDESYQAIHEKGHRNQPLREQQKAANTRKSKVRARVEHIFGFQVRQMRANWIRTIGRRRAERSIGLGNLVYNLFRYVQLGGSMA